VRIPNRELRKLAAEATWMYEWDLGGGVRTTVLGPELMSVHLTRAAIMEPVVRTALNGPGPTGLDLACSEGWFAHRLLEWGANRVVGVDARPENIRRARLVRNQLGVNRRRLRFRTCDIFDLGDFGRFDVVLCLGLIYHLENPVGALRIARRLTRGLCVVESQLTEQAEPIRHGWGETGVFVEQDASWASCYEPDQDATPIASTGGVVSFIPNRAALVQALATAGFSTVEPLAVPTDGNQQYRDGHRVVIAAWP
jgi:tRNA (mo5U34)-methyltransferase